MYTVCIFCAPSTSLQILKNNKASGPICSRQWNSKYTIINIKINYCSFLSSYTHRWDTKFCTIVFLWYYYKSRKLCFPWVYPSSPLLFPYSALLLLTLESTNRHLTEFKIKNTVSINQFIISNKMQSLGISGHCFNTSLHTSTCTLETVQLELEIAYRESKTLRCQNLCFYILHPHLLKVQFALIVYHHNKLIILFFINVVELTVKENLSCMIHGFLVKLSCSWIIT